MNGIRILVLILNMKNPVIRNTFTMRFLKTAFIFVFVFISLHSFSQEESSCLNNLKKAQELFEAGLIEEIPALLDSCLKTGFTKEQAIQAYRLLIQVYLFDYKQELAEQTMYALLNRYPEYEIQSVDPVEFVNLFKQFKTEPKYSIGIDAGINFSHISVLENYTTGNLNKLDSKYKSGGIYPKFMFSFQKYFNNRLSFNSGLTYSLTGFDNEEKMNFGKELLTYSERMSWIGFPHHINYSFKSIHDFTPFVSAGGNYSFLLKSESEINHVSLIPNLGADIKGEKTDITNNRYRHQYFVLLGAGIRYKIAAGYLKLNAYYMKGVTAYINESKRYANPDDLFYYNYVDDKIKLDGYYISVGYSHIFYKTTKKTVIEDSK